MIYVVDNFLEEAFYNIHSDSLKNNANIEVVVGEKSFYIQPASEEFVEVVCNVLSEKEKKSIQPILSFFRCATDKLDNDLRIHSDYIIEGVKPDRACVLYMSKSELEDLNGTAFWEHEHYGQSLPKDVSHEEFDRMILEDSNDITKWKLKSVIGNNENRLVSYPSNYFHSKYPATAWEKGRYVFVMFYKTI